MLSILALFVVLMDSVVTVPPSKWKAVELKIPNHNTTVYCAFTVRSGASGVAALLLERGEAERFHQGRSMKPLYATGFERSGRFRYQVPAAGDYVLLLDNRLEGRNPAEVEIRLELTDTRSVIARELPPDRRRLVVALSMLFFGAVVVFSARQFLKHVNAT